MGANSNVLAVGASGVWTRYVCRVECGGDGEVIVVLPYSVEHVVEFAQYLRGEVDNKWTDEQTAARSFAIWQTVSTDLDALQVPDCSTADDGRVLMTWDDNVRHFEIEVFPGADAEWFYLELDSGTSDGGVLKDESLPIEAIGRLRLFETAKRFTRHPCVNNSPPANWNLKEIS